MPRKSFTRADAVRYIKSHPNLYDLNAPRVAQNAPGWGRLASTSERTKLRNSSAKSAKRLQEQRQTAMGRINQDTGVNRESVNNTQRLRALADMIYAFGYAT